MPHAARWLGLTLAPWGVTVVLCVGLATPARAADTQTLNATEAQGFSGMLFATPPGSCTAAPGGTPGNCSARGTAIVTAAAGSSYFDDNSWSDLEQADVPLTESGNTEVGLVQGDGTVVPGGVTPSPDTDIGTSWLPARCDHPYCGHLLRGDVLQFDENGDGVFDDSWHDYNGNHVIDNGEIDRTRGEQFAWGVTSLVRDLNDLSDMMAQGNAFPAGLARDRVRLSLGAASQVGDCDVPRLDNPACLDGDISSATSVPVETLLDDNSVNGQEVDRDFWGICDPDRFDPANPNRRDLSITTVAEGQRALDNCLWWITSLPILVGQDYVELAHAAYTGGADKFLPDNGLSDRHTEWIAQGVTKETFSATADRQDFGQRVFVAYFFDQSVGLDKGRYQNGWLIEQGDMDPNEAVNGPVAGEVSLGQVEADDGYPWDPVAVDASDTYPYYFAIQHATIARARGFDNGGVGPGPGGDELVAECDPPGVGVAAADCTGDVNETVDPFWHAQIVASALALDGVSFNADFEYHDGEPCETACRISGVGKEHLLDFITVQDVNGYFQNCMGCNDPGEFELPEFTYQPYVDAWTEIPTIPHGGV